MSNAQLFKEASQSLFGFCKEARAWVGNRSLAQAWRDCQKGSWMYWWLRHHLQLNDVCDHMLAAHHKALGFSVRAVDAHMTDEQQTLSAAWIRANYTPGGRRRVVR